MKRYLWFVCFSSAVCMMGCSDATFNCIDGEMKCSDVGNNQYMVCENGEWSAAQSCSGTQVCVNDACIDKCTAGETKCNGEKIVTCDENGKWGEPEECPQAGAVCLKGVCTKECIDGNTMCDANILKTCTDGSWQNSEDCSTEGLVCASKTDGSGYGCLTCQYGDAICSGNTIKKCEFSIWNVEETCNNGKICVLENDTPLCKLECTPGTTKCEDNTLYKCTEENGWGEGERCESNQICGLIDEENQTYGCRSCMEGETKCEGKIVKTCVNGEFTGDDACPSLCSIMDGTAKCIKECENEGETRCLNNMLQICDSDGNWSKGESCEDDICKLSEPDKDNNDETHFMCYQCDNGTTKCVDDDKLYTCVDNRWNDGEQCVNDFHESVTCQTTEGDNPVSQCHICDEGKTRCGVEDSKNTLYKCTNNQWVEVVPCGDNAKCDEKADNEKSEEEKLSEEKVYFCRECNEGDIKCVEGSEDQYQVCVNGKYSTENRTCDNAICLKNENTENSPFITGMCHEYCTEDACKDDKLYECIKNGDEDRGHLELKGCSSENEKCIKQNYSEGEEDKARCAECKNGDTKCDGDNTLITCKNGKWDTSENGVTHCGDNSKCTLNDNKVYDCIENGCTQDDQLCIDNAIYTCQESGIYTKNDTNCTEDETCVEYDVSKKAVCKQCENGATKCGEGDKENTLYKCENYRWQTEGTACEEGYICSEDIDTHEYDCLKECEINDHKCGSDGMLYICENGLYKPETDCKAEQMVCASVCNAQECAEGETKHDACVACTPNETKCDNNIVMTCTENGTWEVKETCQSPKFCGKYSDETNDVSCISCYDGASSCNNNGILSYCTNGQLVAEYCFSGNNNACGDKYREEDYQGSEELSCRNISDAAYGSACSTDEIYCRSKDEVAVCIDNKITHKTCGDVIITSLSEKSKFAEAFDNLGEDKEKLFDYIKSTSICNANKCQIKYIKVKRSGNELPNKYYYNSNSGQYRCDYNRNIWNNVTYNENEEYLFLEDMGSQYVYIQDYRGDYNSSNPRGLYKITNNGKDIFYITSSTSYTTLSTFEIK